MKLIKGSSCRRCGPRGVGTFEWPSSTDDQSERLNLAIKLKANYLIQLSSEQVSELLGDKLDGHILPLTSAQFNQLGKEREKSHKIILNVVQVKEMATLNGLQSFDIDYLAFKHGK